MERLRAWGPELGISLLVLLIGFFEAATTDVFAGSHPALVVVAILTAIAVGLCRRAPAVGLGLAWLLAAMHLLGGVQPMFVEIALVAVMFGTARWGHPGTAVAGGLSIPLVPAAGVLTLLGQGYDSFVASPLGQGVRDLYYPSSVDSTTAGLATTIAVIGTVLTAPWLAGLALRFSDRARASRDSQTRAEERAGLAVQQTEQAREIARLRDEQARLARDVHDVVGHSLAVILAQAESAQFLPDDDPTRLKQTMATIATSARSSLQDVRQVLTAPAGAPVQTHPLDTLVDGVRAGGHEVVVRELGTARPLPPELEVTAYRVLQEMLTNAVKHGLRDDPVFVERHWPDDSLADELRIEVRNAVDRGAELRERGQGLDGMRQRLEAVGGRLDARRREEDDATTFTVTAWVPLGPR